MTGCTRLASHARPRGWQGIRVPRGGLPRPPRTKFMAVPGGLGRPPGGQKGEVVFRISGAKAPRLEKIKKIRLLASTRPGAKKGVCARRGYGLPSRPIPGFQVSCPFADGKYGGHWGLLCPSGGEGGGTRKVGQKCGSTPAQAASTMLVAARTVRKGHASQGLSGVRWLSATLSSSTPSSRRAVSSRGRREVGLTCCFLGQAGSTLTPS